MIDYLFLLILTVFITITRYFLQYNDQSFELLMSRLNLISPNIFRCKPNVKWYLLYLLLDIEFHTNSHILSI